MNPSTQQENRQTDHDAEDSLANALIQKVYEKYQAASDAIYELCDTVRQLRDLRDEKEAREYSRAEDLLLEKIDDWQCMERYVKCALDLFKRVIDLESNDPFCVGIDASSFPEGYGNVLGNALLTNTVVSLVDLDLSLFLGNKNDPNQRQAIPMQRFLSSCPSLRTLQLRVEKTFSGPQIEIPLRLAEKLLYAASENASIEELSCIGSAFSCTGVHYFLSKKQYLKSLILYLDGDISDDVHSPSDKTLFVSSFHSKLTIENLKMRPNDK